MSRKHPCDVVSTWMFGNRGRKMEGLGFFKEVIVRAIQTRESL
jgi:hypothetical protein